MLQLLKDNTVSNPSVSPVVPQDDSGELLDAVEHEVGRLVSYPAEPFGAAGLATV